jgi:type I restriction enzyme S subunit
MSELIAVQPDALPSEWKREPLHRLVEFWDGRRIPLKQDVRDGMEGSVPYYGASGIIDYVDDFLFDDDLILVGEDGENVVSRNLPLAFRISGQSWVNNHAHVLKPFEYVDIAFLTEFLEWLDYSAIASGSAQPKITQRQLKDVVVTLPPLPQQRKIARILTTLDNVIAQTEALIAKYQAIKQGLMHDLFTRGVDATGKLRPPQSEAPEVYKQSDLGWIPKEWEVMQLGEVIGPIVSGWSPICDGVPADQDEWAILKTTAVVWEGYQETENKRLPKGLEPLADLQVQKDDILITRKGPMDRVGVVAHVHATRTKLMIPDTVLRLRILPGTRLVPAFLPLTLASEVVQRDWLGKKIGLAEAQVDINHRILKGTVFAKPSIDEQTRIIERYRSASTRITEIKREVQKYRSVKTGLMQDLLTGKVPVTADEPEEITS